MDNNVGYIIAQKRKELGYTQQRLAERLGISFQAVSKWENGASTPDISLLPQIAHILNMSVDALVGYHYAARTDYDDKYKAETYYWGLKPNNLCYEIMQLMPPIRPYRVLDIGCGEGKDAVFLARNGYKVSAFDLSQKGLEKARILAEANQVEVDFFRADVNDFVPQAEFDIIFSSGVFHYIEFEQRKRLIDNLKAATTLHGINAINVFVDKPFIEKAPDREEAELKQEPWYSGELFRYYHDWMFYKNDEVIFDCNSGGVPHKHCMDILVARKETE